MLMEKAHTPTHKNVFMCYLRPLFVNQKQENSPNTTGERRSSMPENNMCADADDDYMKI